MHKTCALIRSRSGCITSLQREGCSVVQRREQSQYTTAWTWHNWLSTHFWQRLGSNKNKGSKRIWQLSDVLSSRTCQCLVEADSFLKMKKNVKSLRNLAMGLMVVTLCITVQESESAVSNQPTITLYTCRCSLFLKKYKPVTTVKTATGSLTPPRLFGESL